MAAKKTSGGKGSEKLVLNPKRGNGKHAKSASSNKKSATYKKLYAGQGR